MLLVHMCTACGSVCLFCRALSVKTVMVATDTRSNKNEFVQKTVFYNTGDVRAI
jgi:hypothetical protein